MSNFTISARLPMVWFLLGLLLNAAGLYIGFDSPLSFVLIVAGWFCCAFGLALFVLRRMEKPKSRDHTRLSSKFISAGGTAATRNDANSP
ncbi:MAG TPA: hypothetical protein VLA06_06455 [Woeseiaceae bacterium]|jgi:nitrate reductase gamma subunit|nr:hypothetical protein [Woeseiaceae bacterium]